ncbi:gluconate 2-dehydrogenase subunit 3 family protein [Saccharopolyspora rhizosphaerae]|uniref:gluconate 2-dehydrogenase subunit 3 family protein n=1 Tax=Saccharopolyspora rhizosphaerae TaxID=2492662 RepID=UPI0013154F70|nr:gluconate 2-dehydrogenase subunit 3 family protein [Saccharopolyspora rhizosphaerae]
MVDLKLSAVGGKPPLGGWLPPIRLTERQGTVLNAVADEFIPGGDGFPPPSDVDVLSFITRYVTPAGQDAKWFPFLGENDFKARLEKLGDSFLQATSAERVAILSGLEWDEPEFFGHLRDVVYYAYYSRPAVVHTMNRSLRAGRDYRLSPQPYGYTDVMDDWDDELLARVRGSYRRTAEVRRIEVPAHLREATS